MVPVANNRYIKRSAKGGGWDVVKEGHLRATGFAKTKDEAVKKARTMIQREGGGEVRVLNKQGKITDSNTVRPRKRHRARTGSR